MSIIDDSRYESLDAKLDKEHPKPWNFTKDGPKIVGEFVELTEGYTARGPCKLVTLRTQDGTERSVWLFHTVLRSQFASVRPGPPPN